MDRHDSISDSGSLNGGPRLGGARFQPGAAAGCHRSSHRRLQAEERRRCQRFTARNGAFALLRPGATSLPSIGSMSMGDIACAVYRMNPYKMGQIKDISNEGLCFSYIGTDASCADPLVLDILSVAGGFYLSDLRFSAIRDRCVSDDAEVECVPLHELAVQFADLSPDQQAMLETFIQSHTAD